MNNVDKLFYFLVGYWQVHKAMPTLKVIIDVLGFKSPATALACLNRLQARPDFASHFQVPELSA